MRMWREMKKFYVDDDDDLQIAGEMKFYTNETVMYLDSSNSRLVFKSS